MIGALRASFGVFLPDPRPDAMPSRLTFPPYAVVSLLLALHAASARAGDPESVDFYAMGGALRGLDQTTWTASSGFIYRPEAGRWGLGFAYVNDGHPTNNHRDGFTAQIWYAQPLPAGLELQVGAGPYASMNNTTVDGIRYNQFRTGVLGSAALKWHPPGAGGWYLRAQVNGAAVPRSFDHMALLFGAGYDFDAVPNDDRPHPLRADVGLWAGTSRTTQLGEQKSGGAFQIEAQVLTHDDGTGWTPSAWSIAFLSEGDTNLVNRKGVPLQAWWRTAPSRFTFSFGLGPYFAYDGYRDQRLNLMGIGSVRISMRVAETRRNRFEAGFMYTRVASFYNRDEDIFMLGVRVYEKE